jgi:hypothetical protein
VGVLRKSVTGLNVIAAMAPGVAVSLPVTGRKIRPGWLGAILTSICFARATAVLFILAKDKSCVLRACRSMAVGGAGSRPATRNIIHAILEQSMSAAKA